MKKSIITIFSIFIAIIGSLSAKNNLQFNENNIDNIIKHLSVLQKAQLLVGAQGIDNTYSHKIAGAAGYTFAIDSMGIPSINLADGPVGVRIHPTPSKNKYTQFCTCFPSSTALAATWDIEMARIEGNAIGDEAKAYGVDIILTPGINIMRNPLCGRNFEYFSEDPCVSGIIGAAMINGIQEKGIGTSLKHFVANNQQTGKLYNDARISQRALREIYLKGFEICLKKSNPWTIMGSYNKIGGKYTQTNSELLRSLLRDEWGYKGLVMTDWYKKRNTTEQLIGGTDLMMPGEQSQIDEIVEGVKNGTVNEAILDQSVKNILKLVLKSITYKGWKYNNSLKLEGNALLSRKIASESMVLLKNDSSFLPIATNSKIALFGSTGYKSIAGGTGSSNVNKPYIVDISTGLKEAGFILNNRLNDIYTKYIDFQNNLHDNNPKSTDWEKLSYNRTLVDEMDLSKSDFLITEAAKESEIAIIVIGRGSGEESDRVLDGGFNLTTEEKFMIEKVTSIFHSKGKKVVVIMNVCGVMEMSSWKDIPDAILLAWLPGQECGHAISDVITGKTNPSGRLPMTFPIKYQDIPSSKNFPTVGVTKSGKNFDYTNYEEDIWVGYRYFNTIKSDVAYPFGYGLSYTKFEYSKPSITKNSDKWIVSVKVTNIGKTTGKEVVQLYISAPKSSLIKPSMELKAFSKTKDLKPNESEIVEMQFTNYDLASFDEINSQWLTTHGEYIISLGASSRDLRTTLKFNIKNDKKWKVKDLLRPVEKINIINISQ